MNDKPKNSVHAVYAKDVFKNVMDENGAYEILPSAQCLAWSDSSNPAVPVGHDDYVFRKELLQEVLHFLMKPNGDALYVSGPTGSGKTSLMTEVCARLNWPVQSITMNGRFEFSQLKGQFTVATPKEGGAAEMKFMHGPLARAMRFGHVLLLNEIDLADPSELSGLNDVLEGRPLVIAENRGEIIKPHPMFRVVVTGNSWGSGDSTGLYQGIQTQNLAALDRYRLMKVGYADASVEESLLKKVLPTAPADMIKQMVQLANQIRTLFLGERDDGVGQLSVTMSTRCLKRWAQLTQDLSYTPKPLKEALTRSLLLRMAPSEAATVENIAVGIFGSLWADGK